MTNNLLSASHINMQCHFSPFFRFIKEFDTEVKDVESKNSTDVNRMLNEKKQSMVRLYFLHTSFVTHFFCYFSHRRLR